jgi:putative protein-disulfide isomerase
MDTATNSRNEIIYLFDPLCGWCYGFGPQIKAFSETHPEFDYTVLSGGMVTGARVGPLSQIAPYIKEGVQRVEELSGVKFGQAFLSDLHGDGKTHMDSTPPSKAFVILKEAKPKEAVALAHAVQAVFYRDGLDLNEADSYKGLCDAFGVDFIDFASKFNSMEYQLAAKDEFNEVGRYGVSGYPTVVARFNQQYYMIGHGFAKAAQLSQTLANVIQKEGLTL